MGKIISLSGCRAVGKTTLVNGIRHMFPEVIIREGFRRKDLGFNLEIEEEYYANEKWYIEREIAEFDAIKSQNHDALLLRGPEDLEAYALHYPILTGKKWDVENHLKKELEELRKRHSDQILYLTASKETIISRCQKDKEKTRNNLQEWVQRWEPVFDCFIRSKDNVFVLNTDELSADEVLNITAEWMRRL